MKLQVIFSASVLAVSVATVPAHATGGSANFGDAGASYIAAHLGGGQVKLSGLCKYVRHAAGVGGGGITYQIVGVGTAGGAYKGVPVVATGVRCRFHLGSTVFIAGPEYLPGPVAETDLSVTSDNAAGGRVCVTVFGVLRQTPPGESDNLIVTPEQC